MTTFKVPQAANWDSKLVVDPNRSLFIDYLRGFVVAVMVMDHAVQGYATHFGRFWFLADTTRDPFFDVLHMISNAYIMPILFLLAGMFVLPSLERRGFGSFFKEKVMRLLVPFAIFMPLLTPLMSYPRYVLYTDPSITIPDFYILFFTSPLLQAGPYWFIGFLFQLTMFAVLLHYTLPFILSAFEKYVTWMTRNPLLGLITIGGISGSLVGVSDLTWGAPWWIGWEKVFGDYRDTYPLLAKFMKLFHFQASRFALFIYYFFMGIGFVKGGHLKDRKFLGSLSDKWFPLCLSTVILGTGYIWYSLTYYEDGAYCHHSKGLEATLAYCDATLILARTYMHGFFCALITLSLISVFYKFLNTPKDAWISLGRNAFGIYLIHEVFTVQLQYFFFDSPAPVFFKFICVWGLSFGLSWLLMDKIFRRLPLFNKIL